MKKNRNLRTLPYRLNRWMSNVRIKNKILLIFLIGIILPVITVLSILTYVNYVRLTEMEQALIEGEGKRISANFISTVETAERLADSYASDKDLLMTLETYGKVTASSIENVRALDDEVQKDIASTAAVQDITVYYTNENLFDSEHMQELSAETQMESWFLSFITANKSAMLLMKNTETPTVIYVQKLNLLRSDSDNLLVITLSTDYLNSLCDSELFTDTDNYFFLEYLGTVAAAANGRTVSGGDYSTSGVYNSAINKNPLLSGWVLRAYDKEHVLSNVIVRSIGITAALVLAVLFISFLAFITLSRSIIKRLMILSGHIRSAGTDELNIITERMGRDEIGEIAQQYNHMVVRTSQLMIQLRRSNENVSELLSAKTEAYSRLSRVNAELAEANEELQTSLSEISNRDEQIQSLAFVDTLTGLANRYAITVYIKNIFQTCEDNFIGGIAFLDIDDFKYINDAYGHDIGDEVIKNVGTILSGIITEDIRVARMGGDEFLIFFGNCSEAQIFPVCEKIRTQMRGAIVIESISFYISISIGIALYPSQGFTMHELVKKADIALYRAKERGKDRTVVFDADMNQQLEHKLRLHELIMQVSKTHSFYLKYQPYFAAASGELVGCEALIRWHKDRGLDISPYELIKNAEEIGLIIELGEWIFTQACLFAKRINRNSNRIIPVSVNISVMQLMHADFFERIAGIIDQYAIDPKYICLEMTETVLMNSIEKGSYIIHKLRALGFSISLDDFGTGYSSLKYFKDLPITTLKIDKAFIDHIAENEYDRQLVSTMIHLAHNKHLSVIAEGVETPVQREALINLGCDHIQGYLFSKPVTGDMLEKMIQRSHPAKHSSAASAEKNSAKEENL